MNMVISEVPFGTGSVDAHMDTTSGELVMDKGHIDGADLKLGIDWATAKAILIDQNAQAGMQAFMAGKIKVMEGDMTKLLAMQAQAASPDPVAKEVADKIQGITEWAPHPGRTRATEPKGAAAPAVAGEHCLSYATPLGPAPRASYDV